MARFRMLQGGLVIVVAGLTVAGGTEAQTRRELCLKQYREAVNICAAAEGGESDTKFRRCGAKHDPAYQKCLSEGPGATPGATTPPPASTENKAPQIATPDGPTKNVDLAKKAYEARKYADAIAYSKRALDAKPAAPVGELALLYYRKATCQHWIGLLRRGTVPAEEKRKPGSLETACANAKEPGLAEEARQKLSGIRKTSVAKADVAKPAYDVACLELSERRSSITCEMKNGFKGKSVYVKARLKKSSAQLKCPSSANLHYSLPHQSSPQQPLWIDSTSWSYEISGCGGGLVEYRITR